MSALDLTETWTNNTSVYIARQVLLGLLNTFKDKVDGQEALANKKSSLIYETLDKYPQTYKVIVVSIL